MTELLLEFISCSRFVNLCSNFDLFVMLITWCQWRRHEEKTGEPRHYSSCQDQCSNSSKFDEKIFVLV